MRGGGDRSRSRVRVLGVDPGTAVTGWGVIERRAGAVSHLAHGTVTPDVQATLPVKLAAIHDALVSRCAEWQPDVIALEKSFVGRNVQSAFRLGEVRGVVMLVAARAGLAIAEYSPAEVKLAVTGSGRAEKLQVARAIARELALAGALASDAADALALALCHAWSAPHHALASAVAQGPGLQRAVVAAIEREARA